MCRDARIQRRAGCAFGARGSREVASDIPCPHAAFARPCASQGYARNVGMRPWRLSPAADDTAHRVAPIQRRRHESR